MAEVKQVYGTMQSEIDNMHKNIIIAEMEIENYRRTTLNLPWYGDAREAVDPILDKIQTDIVSLRNKVEEFMREAGVSAERMQQQSDRAVQLFRQIHKA